MKTQNELETLDNPAISARIADFCNWKGIELPEWVSDVAGSDVDLVIRFCEEHDVSLDWVICNSGPHPSSIAGRLMSAFRRLEPERQRVFIEAMEARPDDPGAEFKKRMDAESICDCIKRRFNRLFQIGPVVLHSQGRNLSRYQPRRKRLDLFSLLEHIGIRMI